MTFPLQYGTDIKTRVVLSNESRRTTVTPAMAGKVGLIGAFPTNNQEVKVATSYPDFLKKFKLRDTQLEEQYDGMRAVKKLFMTDFPDYPGASSVTCVNITGDYEPENTLTLEMYENAIAEIRKLQARIDEIDKRILAINARLQAIDAKLSASGTTAAEKTELQKEKTDLQTQKEKLIGPDGNGGSKKEIEEAIEEFREIKTLYGVDDIQKIELGRHLTFSKLKLALNKLLDEDIDILFISSDLHDCYENYGDGTNGTDSTQAKNIGQVYDYLINFLNNEFSSHHQISYIGWLRTNAGYDDDYSTKFHDPEITNYTDKIGIGTSMVNVYGKGDLEYDKEKQKWDMSKVTKWGCKQIAKLFTNPSNELCTSGLFIQGGTLNGVKVDAMELTAHICGWIAGMRVNVDPTYQTIPGLTKLTREVYFGPYDAGTVLNNFGIQVIKTKSRLENTHYINNCVMPSGWHTNHVRSVNYLLKKYQFEAGLGMNNFTANVEAFRASLETINKEVLADVDVIRSITIGDIEVVNNYHIYVPIDIVLAGVVTKISVGVSMSLDETGVAGTTLSTNGYAFYYDY